MLNAEIFALKKEKFRRRSETVNVSPAQRGIFDRFHHFVVRAFVPVLAAANIGSRVDPHNKLGCWMQVPVLSARGI